MSKKPAKDIFAVAGEVATSGAASAPLVTKSTAPKPTTRPKLVKPMPVAFYDAHATLKAEGKTAMDFSAYIIEAVREKLKRDGAI